MSEIRCPRRECRKRKHSIVTRAFLIGDEGGVVYGPLAQPHFVDAEGRWRSYRSTDANLTAGPLTAVVDWDATRSVPAHFRCVCGHRYVWNGRNETLRLTGGRVYDAFEVARLVKGQKAGWPRPDAA